MRRYRKYVLLGLCMLLYRDCGLVLGLGGSMLRNITRSYLGIAGCRSAIRPPAVQFNWEICILQFLARQNIRVVGHVRVVDIEALQDD